MQIVIHFERIFAQKVRCSIQCSLVHAFIGGAREFACRVALKCADAVRVATSASDSEERGNIASRTSERNGASPLATGASRHERTEIFQY